MPELDYDPRRDAEELERREWDELRHDTLLDSGRHWEGESGLVPVFRADENIEQEAA